MSNSWLAACRYMYNISMQVLGVSRAASRETCIQASEKLLGSVPDVGYSQASSILDLAHTPSESRQYSASLFAHIANVANHGSLESQKHHAILQDLVLSRALALEATTSVLLDYGARRAYDRSHQIEVSYADMPGNSSSMPRPPVCFIMQPQLIGLKNSAGNMIGKECERVMHSTTALSMGAHARAFCQACAPPPRAAACPELQRSVLAQLEACSARGECLPAAAGAFALMQEAGDVQPVIRWGRAWLKDNGFDRRARDVALTAALAHCDLAGMPPRQPLCIPAAQCTECCLARATPLVPPLLLMMEDGKRVRLAYSAMWGFSRTYGVQRTGWRSTARTGCRMLQRC